MRNGRGLSDQWAESVVVRPRTTERHITVHKRLVLGFALSILTLIIVTAVAVVLSVRFEECGGRDRDGATGESGTRGGGGSARLNGKQRGEDRGEGGRGAPTVEELTAAGVAEAAALRPAARRLHGQLHLLRRGQHRAGVHQRHQVHRAAH
ncbi:Thyrotropin-releasing hormone-degrading ectoenzyme [Nibea albiflora]|nr:Thyrotropin-releasing hormone-degrading ectoenzyme [Nibea albiflora]